MESIEYVGPVLTAALHAYARWSNRLLDLAEQLIGGYGQAIYAGILNGLPGLNYVWFVDLLFAGIIGVGLYFTFLGGSGAVLPVLCSAYAHLCAFLAI